VSDGRADEGRIELRDGRALTWAEYGDACGRPVLYFHGFPGSRLEASLATPAARDLGVRLIAPDRPGYGGSAPSPRRRIGDWPDDVAELADALGLDRFAAVGVSGGGPYLLACALRLRGRLGAAGVLCGLGPIDRPGATEGMLATHRLGLALARLAPWSARPLAALVRTWLLSNPERAFDTFVRRLPSPDRKFLAAAAVRSVFVESYRVALGRGSSGVARDLQLYARPWGFSPREIEMLVHVWHGELDTVVPPSFANALVAVMPRARARFFAEDAHFSLAFAQLRPMLRQLVDELGS